MADERTTEAKPILPRGAAWGAAGICLLAALALFALQARPLFQTPRVTAIFGWDDTFYYAWLRSAFVGGDADFADEIRDAPTLPDALKIRTLAGPRTEAGRIPNKYPIGWALCSAPFYVMADALMLAARGLGWTDLPRDGYGPAYQTIILLGQLAYAAAGMVLAFLVLRRFASAEAALLGVALTWLTSFLTYYQTVNLALPHSLVFFWVAATYWLTFRLGEKPEPLWPWAVLGFAGGMLVLCRYQAAVYLLFPAAWLMGRLRPARQGVPRALAAAAPLAALIFLQLLAWKAVYGRWLVYTYGEEGFRWLRPRPLELLFSPYHGLYYWHPLLLAATAGFIAFLARRRDAPRAWLAVFLLTLYVNASWETWWFGASFGSRAFEGCVLFFMAGTAWLFRSLTERRGLAWALLAVYLLAGVWNLNLTWLAKRNVLRGDRPATHAEMLRATLRFWFEKDPLRGLDTPRPRG